MACVQGLARQQPQQLQALQPQPAQAAAAHYYAFRERLQRGVILRRRARFTLEVAADGETLLCYCPTTFMFLSGSRLNGEQVQRCCLPGMQGPALLPSACTMLAHAASWDSSECRLLSVSIAMAAAVDAMLRNMHAHARRQAGMHACMHVDQKAGLRAGAVPAVTRGRVGAPQRQAAAPDRAHRGGHLAGRLRLLDRHQPVPHRQARALSASCGQHPTTSASLFLPSTLQGPQ
jgi:hypothetical protein